MMSMAAQSEALMTASVSQRMQSIQTFALAEHEELKEIGRKTYSSVTNTLIIENNNIKFTNGYKWFKI